MRPVGRSGTRDRHRLRERSGNARMNRKAASDGPTEGTTMPDDAARRRGRGTRQDVDRHVARMIHERRSMLGLTQQQVAEQVGTTYQQVYKYERGLDHITAGRLHRIA